MNQPASPEPTTTPAAPADVFQQTWAQTHAQAVADPKADLQRYYMLAHGSHLVDTARFFCGEIVSVDARLTQRYGAYCWFVATEFANGAVGHLDLTVSVRMDWHEGVQIYGQHGSVLAKTHNPWLFKLIRRRDLPRGRYQLPSPTRCRRTLLPPPAGGLRRCDPRRSRRDHHRCGWPR